MLSILIYIFITSPHFHNKSLSYHKTRLSTLCDWFSCSDRGWKCCCNVWTNVWRRIPLCPPCWSWNMVKCHWSLLMNERQRPQSLSLSLCGNFRFTSPAGHRAFIHQYHRYTPITMQVQNNWTLIVFKKTHLQKQMTSSETMKTP